MKKMYGPFPKGSKQAKLRNLCTKLNVDVSNIKWHSADGDVYALWKVVEVAANQKKITNKEEWVLQEWENYNTSKKQKTTPKQKTTTKQKTPPKQNTTKQKTPPKKKQKKSV
jgi:DNA polymerase III epsilon subunit-like protein